jgi:TPR repeat protein
VAPVIVPPVAVAPVDPGLAAVLMRRGEGLLRIGDISAARLAFARAVAAGSGAAATALGRTYDPAFLAAIGGRGIAGDAAEARRWYQRGQAMGDPDAAAALRQLAPP